MPPSRPLTSLCALAFALLACSGVNDVIGQRPPLPTVTAQPFSTATPGGKVSVILGDSVALSVSQTPVGQLLAPAATATALSGTIQAATATAQATPLVPLFVPSDCPMPGAPPPPIQPAAFANYPEAIGRYLSAGGTPALLEGALREWGTVREGAVVQADTDLTGDNYPEILVAIYDPALWQEGQISVGQLLVYGCAQGGYRLLFSTIYSPTNYLPSLKRVGDMNGDFRAELVFSQQTCELRLCAQNLQIYSWSAALGVFQALNNTPIGLTGGKAAIADLDNDGVLELAVNYPPVLDAAAGPTRDVQQIWDWDGRNYRLAIAYLAAPVYRIHALHDADQLFRQDLWREAIRGYDQVRDNPALQAWTNPNEYAALRAYAGLKKMLAQMVDSGRTRATRTLETLIAENPPGSPGEGYVLVAQAFMDGYNTGRTRSRGCTAALKVASSRPDTLIYLNGYGYANPTYSFDDLCPFKSAASS
jgi:hypothetical protein